MTINFLNILQVLVTIAMIGFILFQRGPGATAGSAFGSGASGTVFGAKGSSSFLSKSTAVLATLFFIITMAISIDFQSTYGVTEQSGAQDLGVMGTIDNKQRPESLIPDEGGATSDNLSPVQTQAPDSVDSSQESTAKPDAEEAATAEPQEQPIDEDQGGEQ